MSVLTAAESFAAAGCCVIPAAGDGSKRPAVDWKGYQTQHPTLEQLHRWFGPAGFGGLGVVCGVVSGGLEMLELEGRAAELGGRLASALVDHGAGDLWARLCTGYLEQSAGGGYHWLYRVVDVAPRRNTKLARRPANYAELAENPGEKVKVLIETRGEGGFVVTAPSNGTTHPTGRSWVLLAGGPASIPAITGAERDLLHAVCTLFDQMPVEQAATPIAQASPSNHAGELRPGDDYNERATWEEILEPHGWTKGRRLGPGWAWTRPGKHPRDGFSATTGQARDADRLYVFSTSTDFDTETPYSKFGAHALLEHDGDHAAAAAALRHAGYGAPLEQPRPLLFAPAPPGAETPPPGPAPPDPQDGPEDPQGATVDFPAGEPGPTSYSLTDDGNALRLVDRHQRDIRYVPQRGLWLRWAGHVWTWDEAETVRELARGIARDLPLDNQQRARHRAKSLSSGAISAQVRLAQTDPRVTTHVAALDAHPFQLNTPGGVVDLTTGRLSQPDPAQLHTRCTNVAPDPTLPAPRWERFLADTFAGDPELITYLQRLIGVALIGEVLEQILPFAYGSGANGKTTLLGVIQRIIGFGATGYAISAPAELLLATGSQDHPASIAQLSGARLVVTSELEEGQRFAEARVKQLTGRDAINARFMRQNPFTFTPSHTLFLLANHQPSVKSGGLAFWRRIAMLPFLHTVALEDRDPHLEDHLVEQEGPAVLAWCIAGAAGYLDSGLQQPESVRAATDAYERDQDSVSRFVDEVCEVGDKHLPHLRTKVLTVRSAYESWCHVEGEQPVSPKAFTQALRAQYDVWSDRSNQTRYYLGISVDEGDPTALEWPSRRPEPDQLRWDQQ